MNAMAHRFAAKSQLYRDNIHHVTLAVENMLRDGVAIIDMDWTVAKPEQKLAGPAALRSFLRAVAKEQKRPFVYIEERSWCADIVKILYVPRQKRLGVIVSSLILCAENTKTNNVYIKGIYPVEFLPQTTLWVFRFNGTDGLEILNVWLERCKIDPEFKSALRTI